MNRTLVGLLVIDPKIKRLEMLVNLNEIPEGGQYVFDLSFIYSGDYISVNT